MSRRIRLDLVLKSGAAVRIRVKGYTITRGSDGSVRNFEWTSCRRHRLLTVKADDIAAIVRITR